MNETSQRNNIVYKPTSNIQTEVLKEKKLNDTTLLDLILAQSSEKESFFDIISKKAANLVKDKIKANSLNAIISNLIINFNGNLIYVQLYVKRNNAFAPAENAYFGTNPVSYEVQARFPYGCQFPFGEEMISIPCGNFINPLKPYINFNETVSDDVKRENAIEDIIRENVSEITFNAQESQLWIRYNDPKKGEMIEKKSIFPYSPQEPQKKTPTEYRSIEDYQESLEKEVYSFFYAPAPDTQPHYVFEFSKINDTDYKDGMPIERLRTEQIQLFKEVRSWINSKKSHSGALANMGFGGGKTYLSFTLSEDIKKQMKASSDNHSPHFSPPLYFAPDTSTANAINSLVALRGISSDIKAFIVDNNNDLPNENTLSLYDTLSRAAVEDSEALNNLLSDGLQRKMLSFCAEKNYHPIVLINFLYNAPESSSLFQTFKESLDPKRLFLIISTRKDMSQKTGMSAQETLRNILEHFKTIQKDIQKNTSYLNKSHPNPESLQPSVTINYAQPVNLNDSAVSLIRNAEALKIPFNPIIQMSEITEKKLGTLLIIKYKIRWNTQEGNLRGMRDFLIKRACLISTEAFELFANSGGLGSTSSKNELIEQINQFLPLAFNRVNFLLNKPSPTLQEHYEIYLFLSDLFSTMPQELDLKKRCPNYQEILQPDAVKNSIDLLDMLINIIEQQLGQLKTLKDISYEIENNREVLHAQNIQEDTQLLEATRKLASICSLRITGKTRLKSEDADLILKNTPIFTPEGFLNYLEFLQSLEGKAVISYQKNQGIYLKTHSNQIITKKNIQRKMEQVFKGFIIADEAHKSNYAFFHQDVEIAQKISAITQKYLEKAFHDIPQPRLGLTGTPKKKTSGKAFPQKIYGISIQKMISNSLVKKMDFDFFTLDLKNYGTETYAKEIVSNYFLQNTQILIDKSSNPIILDLFENSKGIIFSKKPNEELNEKILQYFNLLIKDKNSLSSEESNLQKELFQKINEKRTERNKVLEEKWKIDFPNNKNPNKPFPQTPPFDANKIKSILKTLFIENQVALYIEYLSKKTASPKEASEVVGLKNRLHEKNQNLQSVKNKIDNPDICSYQQMIAQVDPEQIHLEDAKKFISNRFPKGNDLQEKWANACDKNKRRLNDFINTMRNIADDPSFEFEVATKDVNQFEEGRSLVLLGKKGQQTAYSHEHVGIIIDVPSNLDCIKEINTLVSRIQDDQPLETTDQKNLLKNLNRLRQETFNYEEKSQLGGRALRTTKGTAKFVEYTTKAYDFNLADGQTAPLKVETSFKAIFIPSEKEARKNKKTSQLNRKILAYYSNLNENELVKEKNNLNIQAKGKNKKIQFQKGLKNIKKLLPDLKVPEITLLTEIACKNPIQGEMPEIIPSTQIPPEYKEKPFFLKRVKFNRSHESNNIAFFEIKITPKETYEATLTNLKKEIFDKTEIAVDKQKLVFDGKTDENKKTFFDRIFQSGDNTLYVTEETNPKSII